MKKTVLIILLLILISCSITAQQTEIDIIPKDEIFNVDENVTIEIFIEPGQAIKGIEMMLRFNPNVLQAVNVSMGNIFEGYGEVDWFNEGTIDNTNGTIINMHSLIVGQANTTENGTLAKITFMAVNEGIIFIDLYREGICNETQYLNSTTTETKVIVRGEYLPWDINEDGVCDGIDISALLSQYLETGTPGWTREDLNDDGVVNHIDISLFVNYYGI